jgi:hypothetical protein
MELIRGLPSPTPYPGLAFGDAIKSALHEE